LSRVNPFEGIEPNAFLGKVILITGAGSKIGSGFPNLS
jgi:NADP-dependent 3-hydroxy acid dehydrogenase YdfG